MFCPHCGAENPDDASYCVECAKPLAPEESTRQPGPSPPGAPPGTPQPGTPQPGTPQPTVKNYLVEAIVVTIMCCLPFGIVAIIFASQVNSKLQAGDHAGAVAAAQKARTWLIVGAVSGLIVNFILLITMVGQQGF